MFPSGINMQFQRGKCRCLQPHGKASAGTPYCPFILADLQFSTLCLFIYLFILPHCIRFKLFKTLRAFAAMSQFSEFPVWSVLLAVLLHLTVCSCHLLLSWSWSYKTKVLSLIMLVLEVVPNTTYQIPKEVSLSFLVLVI